MGGLARYRLASLFWGTAGFFYALLTGKRSVLVEKVSSTFDLLAAAMQAEGQR